MRLKLIAAVMLLATSMLAQQVAQRDTMTVASGATGTYTVMIASDTHAIEYIISGSPATASIVLQGCMRGGTCTTLETSTATANSLRSVAGLYDYLTVAPTFTGGTSPTVKVNLTSIVSGNTAGRTASATNFALANSAGVGLEEKAGRIALNSAPAVSTLASASVAAGGAGVVHVADCVSFSAGSTTAPVLTQLTINLRDGASGAGTIKHSWTVIIPATTGQNVNPFSVCGLNISGTANTAMTLEFSSLLTNLFENVSLTYYNVN